MLLNRNVLFPLILLLMPAIGSCSEIGVLDRYGIEVLQYASSKDKSTPVAAVGILDGLYKIEGKSKNKENVYLILLDYNLGESGSAVLDELISKSGKKIISGLREKKDLSIHCENKFKSICKKDKNQRNERIDRLIKAIENGVVLCVDINNCNQNQGQ